MPAQALLIYVLQYRGLLGSGRSGMIKPQWPIQWISSYRYL